MQISNQGHSVTWRWEGCLPQAACKPSIAMSSHAAGSPSSPQLTDKGVDSCTGDAVSKLWAPTVCSAATECLTAAQSAGATRQGWQAPARCSGDRSDKVR